MQPKPVTCCAPFEVGTCEDAFFLSVVSREPMTATLLSFRWFRHYITRTSIDQHGATEGCKGCTGDARRHSTLRSVSAISV